jgi:hypothetical protein
MESVPRQAALRMVARVRSGNIPDVSGIIPDKTASHS